MKNTRDLKREQQKLANSVARKFSYGKACEFQWGDSDKVVSHVPYGYRKKTTHEYVPNAYRNNFGWKNTYYQKAETVVQLSCEKHSELYNAVRMHEANN